MLEKLKKKLVRNYYKYRVRSALVLVPHACPLCGNHDSFKGIATTDRFGLPISTKECLVCQLVQTNPMPTEDFLHIFYTTPMYRGLYHGVRKSNEQHDVDNSHQKAGTILRYIEKKLTVPKNATVLDFGSATGIVPKHFKINHPDWQVFGLEPGGHWSHLTQGDFDGLFGSVEDIPPDICFDLITMTHVLEHIREPQQTLSTLHNCLKPHGQLLLEIPSLDKYDYERSLHIAHLYHFNETTITKLAVQTGYTVVAFDYDDLIDQRYGMKVLLQRTPNEQ